MFVPEGNLGVLVDRARDGARPLLVEWPETGVPREWTGNEIEAEADAIARGLLRRGLERGERVAIAGANSAQYLCVYLAIMRAGLVAVPVNTRLPDATIEYVLHDSGARLALTDGVERSRIARLELPNVCLEDRGEMEALRDPGSFDSVRPERDEVAMFLYTSGSTGRPKGVPLTHYGHRWVIAHRFQPGVDYRRQRMLVAAPLYHMNALAVCKFALASGASVVLLPRFSAERYIAAIERFRCTWLTSVPTMLALVSQREAQLARTDLSSVESVRMGSAPVTGDLLGRIAHWFPGARIQIGYGTTEAGPVVFGPHPDGLPALPLSLGVAHPAIDLRLVRGSDRGACEGVLEMRCPALMPGYHNLPEKTEEVMTEDGYYRTGDVMRRDADGFFFFVGRDDGMFVCNGENVYPEEVEHLLEAHPSVAQACVVPVDDPVRGQMPVGFVVAAPGETVDEAVLKTYAIARGPAYQHPRHVFVREALPLAGTNKIDRRELALEAKHRMAERGAGGETGT